MSEDKYDVQNSPISALLSWIKNGEIGLPELQRPFVWSSVKVRDLIDSLYNGFPVGYIITWSNPGVRLKDGTVANGKKIMIDGQQRVTALRAALQGEPVVDAKFKKKRITIAFNPITEEFATLTAVIKKDSRWISDISEIFSDDFHSFNFIPKFAAENDYDPNDIEKPINKLHDLGKNQIGNIILSTQLDIESVTEIFNRINSKGTELSSADFIMSKLSSDSEHGGNNIRKCVEYFSMLLSDHDALNSIIRNDTKFTETEYFNKIKWAAKESSDLYIPRFGDIFHVILGFEFGRGKHSDLVSLVSGRDFKNRTYTEEAMIDAYNHLHDGILTFVNQSNFERYIMILKSMGMQSKDTLSLNGQGVFNFGYSLYLFLKGHNSLSEDKLESIIKRWIVMSAITRRYSGSAESQIEQDIKLFTDGNAADVVDEVTRKQLSESFWNVTLPDDRLITSSTASNVWRIFLMSQVHEKSNAWLERDHRIESLITQQGNIHHVFPKAYLKKHGFSQTEFNQIANYTWLTQPRNLQISDRAPKDYLADVNVTEFLNSASFEENALPEQLTNYNYSNYDDFLHERRVLMSQSIRKYFESL